MSEGEHKPEWLAILFLFVVVPLAFTYGGWPAGLIVLVVGIIALGWRQRHDGPFPTNRE